jgi:hypothetical protein
MAKTVKRIFAVVLLTVLVVVVGCLIHTGNRLNDYPSTLDGYKGEVFTTKDYTILTFTDENVWYGKADEELILLEVVSYEEGVLTMVNDERTYTFLAINENTIYDENEGCLMTRRVSDG